MDIAVKVNNKQYIAIKLDTDDNTIEKIMKTRYNMDRYELSSGHIFVNEDNGISIERNRQYREYCIMFLSQYNNEKAYDNTILVHPDKSDELISLSSFLYLIRLTNEPQDKINNLTEKSKLYYFSNLKNTGRMQITYTWYKNLYYSNEYILDSIVVNTNK